MSSYLPIKYVEWRGVEGLVAAEVLQDDKDGYVTGNVFAVAGVAQIEKSTESASEAKYYDNIPALVVMGKSVDTLTIDASAIPLDVLAYITGNYYDPDTGAMVTGNGETKIFALGYKAQNTDHEDVYVWRYRGVFNVNDVTHITENNSTDANGQTITYTGYETRYVFDKTGRRAKALNVNVALGLADVRTFFNAVTTPDTLTATPRNTKLHLTLTSELTQNLYFTQSAANGVAIDWGDGSEIETVADLNANAVHTYADAGDYVVEMIATGDTTFSPGTTIRSLDYNILARCDFVKGSNVPQLTEVEFGDGCRLDASFGFARCTSITSVTIPNNITEIAAYCFYMCTGLSRISLHDSITAAGPGAFQNTAITTIVLPPKLSIIGPYLCEGCENLSRVVFSVGNKTIYDSAFAFCTALKNVVLPSGFEMLDANVFSNSGVETVYFPASLKTYTQGCFWGCTTLQRITVDPQNPYYTSVDGVLYDKTISKLLQYPTARGGAYTIPNTAIELSNYSFSYCVALTSVSIPSSVKKCGYRLFAYSTALENITMPSTIENVSNTCFESCTALKTVEYAAQEMRGSAFESCTALEKVWIRSSCETIVASSNAYPFYMANAACIVYAEPSSKPAGWSEYWNKKNENETMTTVYNQITAPF